MTRTTTSRSFAIGSPSIPKRLLSRMEQRIGLRRIIVRVSSVTIFLCLSVVLSCLCVFTLTFFQPPTTTTTTTGILRAPLPIQHMIHQESPRKSSSEDSILLEHKQVPQHYSRGNQTLRRNKDTVVSVALCHKTIFGNVNWHHVVLWATYHHGLGFDPIFIWYMKQRGTYSLSSTLSPVGSTNHTTTIHKESRGNGNAIDEGFRALQNLSFVSLVENTRAVPNWNKYGYQKMITMVEPGNQHDDERECLQQKAKEYDWVMNADADEFLWFSNYVSVQGFIQHQEQENAMSLHYLSFGKHMYSTKYRVTKPQSPHAHYHDDDFFWDLEQFPFTARSFCEPPGLTQGGPICPQAYGRAKVLVRPLYHSQIRIHGTLPYPLSRDHDHAIHFPTYVAHLKEWSGFFFALHNAATTTNHTNSNHKNTRHGVTIDPHDFVLSANDAANAPRRHGFRQLITSHQSNENGTYTIHYDDKLHDWLAVLQSRGVGG